MNAEKLELLGEIHAPLRGLTLCRVERYDDLAREIGVVFIVKRQHVGGMRAAPEPARQIRDRPVVGEYYLSAP